MCWQALWITPSHNAYHGNCGEKHHGLSCELFGQSPCILFGVVWVSIRVSWYQGGVVIDDASIIVGSRALVMI